MFQTRENGTDGETESIFVQFSFEINNETIHIDN